jgi:tetratricopeptide (TPR) repeat protein
MKSGLTLLGWACLAFAVALGADPRIDLPINTESPFAHPDNPPDSTGAVAIHAAPEPDALTPFMRQVEYLRTHRDNAMTVAYLEKTLVNPEISEADRGRGMIEISDALMVEHRPAEALCWLRLWLQLHPGRPEAGAVAYRIGSIYTQMGLPGMARDSYYQALASTVNYGQILNSGDLNEYSRLTEAILWALATNEYRAGEWNRALKLFDRYRDEAHSATPASLENVAFLQADCLYQLKDVDHAAAAYEVALQAHPFNPLALEGRLRLYHLHLLKHEAMPAQAELESLIWTVRTVCPKDESYWQKRTADLLLALNRTDHTVLPPLLKKSSQITDQDNSWQEVLNHYSRLAGFQASINPPDMSQAASSPSDSSATACGAERGELLTMARSIAQLAPMDKSVPQ